MTTPVLVAYTTNAGSTAEIARTVGEELARKGCEVTVQPISAVSDVSRYRAVVVGGPMLMGWHPEAVQFLKRHQEALRNKPVAYFFAALSLTLSEAKSVNGCPIFQDPALAKAPQNPARLSFKENFTSIVNYLKPAFTQAPQVKPVSAGFFGGKLDYSQLNLFHRLFVRLIIGAQPGDFRNWEAIRTWAAGLGPALAG